MGLKDLKLKSVYYSDEHNLLEDFYVPALSNSTKYDRIAGYFCSNALAIAAKGISNFVKNGGKIRLIANVVLSVEDQEAIKKAIQEKENDLLIEIEQLEDQLKKDHIRVLCWMIKKNLLEIKIAVVRNGIEHQKTGILEDSDGNIISFSGSDNETVKGWLYNDETFHVFCNWRSGEENHLQPDINQFEKLWNDKGKRVRVYEVSEAFQNSLIRHAPKDDKEFEKLTADITDELLAKHSQSYGSKKIKKEIKLRDYQVNAIKAWLDNDGKGVFEMATGTGKTFTSLGCVKEVLQECWQLTVIIACPYSHLLTQWKNEVEDFGLNGFETVIADSSNVKWKEELVNKTYDIRNKVLSKLMVFTTHATFSNDNFMDIVSNIKSPKVLICDEVHGVGAPERQKGLRDDLYKYRIALSATPSRWYDDEGTAVIYKYFGDTVFSFDLKKAINTINPDTGKTYLVKYDYLPVLIELTEDELFEYESQTSKIAKAYVMSKDKDERSSSFNLLCIKRQEIINNAVNKYNELEKLLLGLSAIKDCLIYCSPNQIDRAQEILTRMDIIQHRFTCEEGTKSLLKYGGLSERDFLLSEFTKGTYQALVAMKCLDQGVNIRNAKTAIFMCSSSNPMEYIQRRGRILRPYEGKDKAIVYDFIVVPPINDMGNENLVSVERKIIKKELDRFNDFADAADNSVDCIATILELYKKFGL